LLSQFFKRRYARHKSLRIPIIPNLTFENIDRILTKEVDILKQYLVSKRTKLLFKQE
jgi:hypothetical protein